MEQQQVILKMDVHCQRCARRIRDAVQKMHGVEHVQTSVDEHRVVISGRSLDAWHLMWRIQSRTKKPVHIVSDGSGGAVQELPAGQMVHLGPTPPAPPLGYHQYSYPYGYGGYGGGAWTAPALRYVSGNAFPYDERQYYRDDDDGPSGCCTMQ